MKNLEETISEELEKKEEEIKIPINSSISNTECENFNMENSNLVSSLSLKVNNIEYPSEDQTTTKSDNKTKTQKSSSTYGPFLGQIMSTIKEICRKSFLSGEPRLIEPLYLCIFQINQENVGKIHSVVSKRRGEIINEIPSDENIKCTIEAIVPVAESFGFVEEIRKKSSGLANPMLRFFKWKIIDVDPFDIPSEEDIINFGVNVDSPNIAKAYINKIRQRKGLVTDEKIVKGADKQKNLAKKR